jgi:hypothetical protein
MQHQFRPFGLAALMLALTSTAAQAAENGGARVDPPVASSSPPASAHAYGDGAEGACDLVTRAEAAKAIGAAVPAGVERNMVVPVHGAEGLKAQYCQFGPELLLARFALGSGGRSTFSKYRKSLGTAAGYREVSGVGDEAFTAKGRLNVRRGSTGLIIDVGQHGGAASRELAAEKALASMALGRL